MTDTSRKGVRERTRSVLSTNVNLTRVELLDIAEGLFGVRGYFSRMNKRRIRESIEVLIRNEETLEVIARVAGG